MATVQPAFAQANCTAVVAKAKADGRLELLTDEPRGIIARVVAASGAASIRGCGRPGGVPAVTGATVIIDDCIVTGANGRVRLIFADRNDASNLGPSVMNIGPNSEMCVHKFNARFDRRLVGVELLFGVIRSFFKGWGRNSSFDVRAGVAQAGIRGSDAIIAKAKRNEKNFSAVLNEGHMSVKAPEQTLALAPGEMVIYALMNTGRFALTKLRFDRSGWPAMIREIEGQQPS